MQEDEAGAQECARKFSAREGQEVGERDLQWEVGINQSIAHSFRAYRAGTRAPQEMRECPQPTTKVGAAAAAGALARPPSPHLSNHPQREARGRVEVGGNVACMQSA